MRDLILPGGANQCHRWTETARDIIVGLGKDYYDNSEYVITYVEWRFSPVWGWIEHGGLKVTFSDGSVIFLDNGTLSGPMTPVSYPSDVPANWTECGHQSLDKPKGMPPYVSWDDITMLWHLVF